MSKSTARQQLRHQRADRRVLKPFAGVDGEGGDIDGKHEYLMLRAGDHLLETGKPLTPYECFEFLADLPKDCIYESFAFDYDVTMMVRKLPPQQVEKLLDRQSRAIIAKDGKATTQYFPVTVGGGKYQIDYMPHKEFKVRRKGGKWTTISDSFTFFQSSFVRALKSFYGSFSSEGIWTADDDTELWVDKAIERIAEGKELRNEFTFVTEYERDYNELECIMLARLMEKFRELCYSLDIYPSKWQGPGNLVTAVFKREGLPQKQFMYIEDEVWYHANEAYYGGRFEAAAYGEINKRVYQYDINSAYASSYRDLPCLRHGEWVRVDNVPAGESLPDDGIYFADVTFRHREAGRWYTLPVRSGKGTLLFPRIGRGWYWHPELKEASKHADITYHRVYRYICNCDCRYFDWVYELYAERDRVGKKSGKGKVLKIVLATIYGKLAQSIGQPAFANPIWSGIVVSTCRASLISAALQIRGGEDVLMLATDGMFSLRPRTLNIGSGLGEWEETVHSDMFIIMSGLYFLPREKPKTRGIPQAKVIEHERDFRDAWRAFVDSVHSESDMYRYVQVTVQLRNFISSRVAVARKKGFLAGRWLQARKVIRFEWASKRIINDPVDFPNDLDGYTLWTGPPEGSPQLISIPKANIGGTQVYKEYQVDDDSFLQMSLEDAPDWADRLWDDEAYE
jgi:hypothetical protein